LLARRERNNKYVKDTLQAEEQGMITIENVAGDHQKEERGNMSRCYDDS
jgi:hypothetical protein